MVTWREAVEKSKIPRVPWKFILGQSLMSYMRDNQYKTNDELIELIMLKVRDKQIILKMQGWSILDINKNLLISISARRAEQKLYSVKGGKI